MNFPVNSRLAFQVSAPQIAGKIQYCPQTGGFGIRAPTAEIQKCLGVA